MINCWPDDGEDFDKYMIGRTENNKAFNNTLNEKKKI